MGVINMCLGALQYRPKLQQILYPNDRAALHDRTIQLLAGDTIDASPPVLRREVTMYANPEPRLVKYEWAVHVNHDLCVQYGGDPGVLSESGLRHALVSPAMTAFGELCYPTIESQIAHLIYFIVCNHVFTDGNKRSAWHLAVDFAASNGYLLYSEYPEDARDAIICLCHPCVNYKVDEFTQFIASIIEER